MSDICDGQTLVEPQSHGFWAEYNYNHAGLRPFFALDNAVKTADGSRTETFIALNETWEVTLYYQDSGAVVPESGTTPAGTELDLENIREFRLQVDAQDGHDLKSVNYHVRPRWKGMLMERNDGSRVRHPVPDVLANTETDAINVDMRGSNIPFDEYAPLLEAAAEAVDVGGWYFAAEERHPTSSIVDMERYVRLHKDVSGPIHAQDGPLTNLAHVMANDRDGYRKQIVNDEDNHGQNLPGFYHAATLGPERVQEVMPSHSLPVRCKHYFEKEALARDDDDPVAHPKLEVSYRQKRTDETLYVDDLESAIEELDEWVYSILSDAGLDLRAGGATYVPDFYFDAENATSAASIVDLDLAQVRHEQESIVYRHLADGGFAPTDRDVLEYLVTDGGEVSPLSMAEAIDRHEDTVYASLQRMHDLVEHQYDSLALKSTYLAELVTDALDEAEKAVERATLASAK